MEAIAYVYHFPPDVILSLDFEDFGMWAALANKRLSDNAGHV